MCVFAHTNERFSVIHTAILFAIDTHAHIYAYAYMYTYKHCNRHQEVTEHIAARYQYAVANLEQTTQELDG